MFMSRLSKYIIIIYDNSDTELDDRLLWPLNKLVLHFFKATDTNSEVVVFSCVLSNNCFPTFTTLQPPHLQTFREHVFWRFLINDLIILEADWLTTVQLRVLALYRQTQHFKRVSCKHTLAYICPFSHLAFNLSNFGSNYTPGGIFHISVDPHPLNNSSHWLASGTRCISSGFPEIMKFERRTKFLEKVQRSLNKCSSQISNNLKSLAQFSPQAPNF